jgi:pyrimidine oxygenase
MTDCGIFLPNGSNGYVMSNAVPTFEPTFANQLDIVKLGEAQGFKYALPMVKFRGFGGDTGCWDSCVEPFTLVAGLAAATETMKFYPTLSTLAVHPVVAAQMIASLDQISQGRCGINIVTGWNNAEYKQMGLWPGQDHYATRYQFVSEYLDILKMIWADESVTYKGSHFALDDCRISPKPAGYIEIVSAGQSEEGLAFVNKYADYRFVIGNPKAVQSLAAARDTSRRFGVYLLFHIVSEDTDKLAEERVEQIINEADKPAIEEMIRCSSADKTTSGTSEILRNGLSASAEEGNLAFGAHPCLYGSHETVANKLRQIKQDANPTGFMFSWADYQSGIKEFGEEILPRIN